MPLPRAFRDLVQQRIARDLAFGDALLRACAQSRLSVEAACRAPRGSHPEGNRGGGRLRSVHRCVETGKASVACQRKVTE